MPAIGFLSSVSSDRFTDRLRAFREGLKSSGYIEGESVIIEYRWAENQIPRPDRCCLFVKKFLVHTG
jgi:putative ABC transport system substrate-binding protein